MNAVIDEKAYAKLNLSLDVSKPRPDGYHDMRMIMQTVSLCDEIRIELNETHTVLAKSNFRYIPSDDRNLAVKAAKTYLSALGMNNTGAVIHMDKTIPVGAGMAGGSSDAAAVLRGLNRHFGKPMSSEELLALSEKIGSDVPFCVLGGTALAEGRGEILTPLNPLPDCLMVICKPEFSVSTPELFKALDRIKLRVHPDTVGMMKALETNDLRQLCRRMYNVFEDVPDRRMNVVREIEQELKDAGAEGAIMTGTGSAVFGIFLPETEAAAENVRAKLEKKYGFCTAVRPVVQQL